MVLGTAPTRHHITKSQASIHAAADRAEPKIRRAILDGLASLERQVPDLEPLIAAGNIDAVVTAIADVSVPQVVTNAVVDATATAAVASATPDATAFNIAFNEVNDRALRWAIDNTLRNPLAGTVPSQAFIRDVVVNATRRGIGPSATARVIQSVVPLLPQHQATVERYMMGIIDAGGTEAYAVKMAARKATKLVKYRAMMIARTEAIRASNMGQQLVWDSAKDTGLLRDTAQKIWEANPGACPICDALDGTPIALGSRWGSLKTPPAHPHCRCTMILDPDSIRPSGQASTRPSGQASTPATTAPEPQPSGQIDLMSKVKDDLTAAERAQYQELQDWINDNVDDDVKAVLNDVIENTRSLGKIAVDAAQESNLAGMYYMSEDKYGRTLQLALEGRDGETMRQLRAARNVWYRETRETVVAELVDDPAMVRILDSGKKVLNTDGDYWATDRMRNFAAEYDAAHPLPPLRPIPVDDLAGTFVHELGHGLDALNSTWTVDPVSESLGQILMQAQYRSGADDMANIYRQIKQAWEHKGDTALWYAATEPKEAFAELFRLYSLGTGARERAAGAASMTAQEWRAAHPAWASMVERLFL